MYAKIAETLGNRLILTNTHIKIKNDSNIIEIKEQYIQ